VGEGRTTEPGLYRYAVGAANLALAAMLAYGLVKYWTLIVPRYGHQFSYVAILMAGIACWMALRGILALLGGRRARRR
jgi:hypothetical protein